MAGRDIMGFNDRRRLVENLNLYYGRISEMVLTLKQRELDSVRAGILNKLERILAIVNNDMGYREGINKLDMAGLRSYERNLNQLLNKMTMGNDRVRARLFSQYPEYSIGHREEPMFKPAGPIQLEDMTTENHQYLNYEFAKIMYSLVGTPYLYGGSSRDGTDCSGSIILALQELGYDVPDATAAMMASGKLDWIIILPTDQINDLSGEAGMINFYDFNSNGSIDHTNVGIGTIGTPTPLINPKPQIVDATEGSILNDRIGRRGQYYTPQTSQINQTYAPYSTNTKPSMQGKINWDILDKKYKSVSEGRF
jgi:hypothetical protein